MLYAFFFFFFNDTATTEIYTLSLHDALPIFPFHSIALHFYSPEFGELAPTRTRSEEHTSELQSHSDLVCRLLLEKKKKTKGNDAFNKQVSYPSFITNTPLTGR